MAGDDDQSIYGFRMAHPQGIRRFPRDYSNACHLTLDICKRCAKNILDLGLFVAEQDYDRDEKPLRSERPGGEVALLRFSDQYEEAKGVGRICRCLIHKHGLLPDQILILSYEQTIMEFFSSLLRQELESQEVPGCNGFD